MKIQKFSKIIVALLFLPVIVSAISGCVNSHEVNTLASPDQSVPIYEDNTNNDITLEDGEIPAYLLDKITIKEFLNNLNINYLANNSLIFIFSIDDSNGRQVHAKTTDGNIEYYSADGYPGIALRPVYVEYLDWMSDKSNFEKILSERGINARLLNYTMIAFAAQLFSPGVIVPPGTYPTLSILLHTDCGDYFLEYKPYIEGNQVDKNFTYDFYTLDEYKAMYGK